MLICTIRPPEYTLAIFALDKAAELLPEIFGVAPNRSNCHTLPEAVKNHARVGFDTVPIAIHLLCPSSSGLPGKDPVL